MATVAINTLKPNELAELACTYAALILHDEGIDVKGDKLAKLITAAGVNVQPFWPKLFAKALQGRSIGDYFAVGGSTASNDAPTVVKQQAAKEAPKKQEKKKQEPKKVEKPVVVEQEDVGMGGLFD